MTIRLDGPTIHLDGDCPVEDAETLLRFLHEPSARTIDWTGAGRLHTAVIQVVLAADRGVRGPCGDPFVARWIELGIVEASAPGM